MGPISEANRLVVTHGNGPQVGLLALKEDAYGGEEPYPLDVLDAETEGQIGYVIELALDNAIDHQDTVAVLTRVLVDGDDPAFNDPTKFIGPIYDEARARELAGQRGWTIKRTAITGDVWSLRPSPRRSSSSRRSAAWLMEASSLCVSAGAGSR